MKISCAHEDIYIQSRYRPYIRIWQVVHTEVYHTGGAGQEGPRRRDGGPEQYLHLSPIQEESIPPKEDFLFHHRESYIIASVILRQHGTEKHH
jgi:hypothetical protein